MFLLILSCLFLPIGFFVGWILRGRNSTSKLFWVSRLNSGSDSRSEESVKALELNQRELQTVKLEQHPESQESSRRIASLTSCVEQQQAFIKQQKNEQLKLRKTVVSIHKKYLQSNTKTEELQENIDTALKLAENQNGKCSADDLTNTVKKLLIQVRASDQIRKEYKSISQKLVASSSRINELESSLKETSGLKNELELAKNEILALRLIEKTAQQEKAKFRELQEQATLQEQQANTLQAKLEESKKGNIELEEKSRQHQSLQKRLDELNVAHDSVVEKLEANLQKSKEYEQTISELQRSLLQAETDQNRISQLEEDLQAARTIEHASAEKLDSLQSSVLTIKQDRDALLSEKDEWRISTTKQEAIISALEEKEQEHLNQLSRIRNDLLARDDRINELVNESGLKEKQFAENQKSIAELESNLQKTKTTAQASAEELDSLNAYVLGVTQDKEALLSEKDDWQNRTIIQESTISELEEKKQEHLDKLVRVRNELVARDEQIAKIRSESKHKDNLVEENNNVIAELERELQTAKTDVLASTEKIDSLRTNLLELKQDSDALLIETDQWRHNAAEQKKTTNALEEKNQEHLDHLGRLHNELVSRDEKIAKLLDESARQDTRTKQLQRDYDSQLSAEKTNSYNQEEMIATLTDKLQISASEIESLCRENKKYERIRSESELLAKEKSELLVKLANSAQESRDLRSMQECIAGEKNELATLFRSNEEENLHLKETLESLKREITSIPKLQATLSESDIRISTATIEINSLQNKLKDKVQLEIKLRKRERDIIELQRQQADIQNHSRILKRELDSTRSILTRCNAALSERTIESQQLSSEIKEQSRLQNKLEENNRLVVDLQKEISSLRELSAAHADLQNAEKKARAKIIKLETRLQNNAQLEQTLRKQEREITEFRKMQAHAEDYRRELESTKGALMQSNTALSRCTAESHRMVEKLKIQQQCQDDLAVQKDILKDMQKRIVAFDAMKFELTSSKEAHEELRKSIPDIEALQKRLRKSERKNRKLDKENESIPRLEQQLAKVRSNKKELNALYKSMGLKLEVLQKENTSHKRRATRLYRQLNPSSNTTVHKKIVRSEFKKTLPGKKSRENSSKTKKSLTKSKQGVPNKKQSTRKSSTGKSVKQSVSRRMGRKAHRSGVPDDLQKIHGIGPVLEKRLHKNGITRFDQLAKLDRSGIVALAGVLGSSSYRIRRDAWVKSAAKLAKNLS